MKSLLRGIVFNLVGLIIVQYLFSGFHVAGGLFTSFIGAVVLTILSFTVKPILKIISLPLNLITFGAFSFIINAIIVYLLTVFVPQIQINAFVFEGISFWGFIIPSLSFNLFFSYIIISLGLSLVTGGARWITKG